MLVTDMMFIIILLLEIGSLAMLLVLVIILIVVSVDCNSGNVVCLISCKVCGFQYVGSTTLSLG